MITNALNDRLHKHLFTWSSENFSQVISFDEQLILCASLGVVDVDDGAADRGEAFDHNGRQSLL